MRIRKQASKLLGWAYHSPLASSTSQPPSEADAGEIQCQLNLSPWDAINSPQYTISQVQILNPFEKLGCVQVKLLPKNDLNSTNVAARLPRPVPATALAFASRNPQSCPASRARRLALTLASRTLARIVALLAPLLVSPLAATPFPTLTVTYCRTHPCRSRTIPLAPSPALDSHMLLTLAGQRVGSG
ncbi:hypothetical protein M5K25_009644 [Dendrobium thyrsiflorum]|uniref:Uncharacterized protein n=1 Tax=Dendrobium thyrsiflorum TaxID=117978 RepID=A0ABD0V642_DENTH